MIENNKQQHFFKAVLYFQKSKNRGFGASALRTVIKLRNSYIMNFLKNSDLKPYFILNRYEIAVNKLYYITLNLNLYIK